MRRSTFLTRGAAVIGAAAVGPVAAAEQALAGVGQGELGLVGLDHVGIMVPDVNQAIEWYEDILGARAPLTFGPFAGDFLQGALDVVAGTQIDQITMLRIGHSAQHRTLRVRIARPAARHAEELRLVGPPRRVLRHGHRGGRGVHGLARGAAHVRAVHADGRPCGGPVDQLLQDTLGLVHRIHQLPAGHGVRSAKRTATLDAEAERARRHRNPRPGAARHRPHRNHGARHRDRGLRRTSATRTRSRSGPSPTRPATFMDGRSLDVHPRAVDRADHDGPLRGGSGPNIELFRYTARPTSGPLAPAEVSDWAGHHLGFYVTDIDKGVTTLQSRAGSKLDGPLTLTAWTGGRAVDQLLPYPVRHQRRAHQLPARHGVREDGGRAALEPEDNHP